MKGWKGNSYIEQDVVSFHYVDKEKEKTFQEIYVWDLDKTYLDTKIEDLKSLIKIFIEKGSKRKNIPGTAFLLKALQEKWISSQALYFISASPPQIEAKIREKLISDQVKVSGFFFKDNLKNVHPKRFQRLTRQIGYKLHALLQLRLRLAADVQQILWGDDSESDAVVYSLYSDLCAGRFKKESLEKVLRHFKVGGAQRDLILNMQKEIKPHDPVEKIYINLEDDTDAEYYLKFGRRMVATYNTLQVAFDLFQDRKMSLHAVVSLAQHLIKNFQFTREQISNSLDDLVRRQILGEPFVSDILEALREKNLIPISFKFTTTTKPVVFSEDKKIRKLEGQFEPWIVENIDYFHDYR